MEWEAADRAVNIGLKAGSKVPMDERVRTEIDPVMTS